jgi:putative radical SAM enzyme (TIGR03279 family)
MIKPGDMLVSVNGYEIRDVLDYRFRMTAPRVVLDIVHGGRRRRVTMRKPEEETDVGLGFETPLMDGKRSCRNKCIFCFIDQNPPGMRESVYFKDDDSRLSFLHGNYITLTNLTRHEIDRIIEMHISPVNVSVHTTNPELRVRMMNNRFAGECLSYLRLFADAGIRICAQIVLCRGINDGAELDRTMSDLTAYLPALDSVSVVPAGLTRHRGGLYPLAPYTPCECAEVIRQVTAFGDRCVETYGQRIFYPADEFYVRGGVPLPDEAWYGDFSQIEDGVGMLASMAAEVAREVEDLEPAPPGTPVRRVSLVTGYAAYESILAAVRAIEKKHGALSVNVIRIRNDFFGESVTVAGLLTGGDIAAQAAGKDLGEALYFPRCALRADGDLFLDDMTPEELSEKLGVPCIPCVADRGDLAAQLLGEK